MEALNKLLILLQFEELLNYGVWDLAINLIIFGGITVPFFLVFWVLYKERFQPRRIQPKRNRFSLSIRRELKYSIISLCIFTVIDALIYLAQLKGYTKLYTDVDKYGWAYLVFSVILIIFLHDALFYFIHRFMHHPKIYNRVHKLHHLSTDPSPFAAFSFHPLEALCEASIYVIFAFLFPVHMAALWAWQIIQVTLNVIAHLGYEIYPENFNRHWLFKFKTPSTHHNMHHAKVNGNYGLYFTWLDKLFKTEFKDYNETYDAIQERIKESDSFPITYARMRAEREASYIK